MIWIFKKCLTIIEKMANTFLWKKTFTEEIFMKDIGRKELQDWLNDYMNVNAISDYLPNGLQVEGNELIKRVATAVSINAYVINKALEIGADTIIVHHGLFWKNDDPTITGYRKSRIKSILENNLNLFAFHLPLDLHPEISHNRLILKNIGIEENNIEPPPVGSGVEYGLIGQYNKELDFNRIVDMLNTYLNTKSKYFKFGKDKIKRVTVVSGAGRTLLDKILYLDTDLYITGDAQENTGYICEEAGFNYIYAGHYNTEKPGIIALGEKLKENFDIEVQFIEHINEL